MEIDNIHGVCGPKCTLCSVYEATEKNDKLALEKIAAEWSASMGVKLNADDIICDGCRVKGGRKSSYWNSCDIKKCADEKGHDICAECESCPCEKIVALPAIEALNELKKLLQ